MSSNGEVPTWLAGLMGAAAFVGTAIAAIFGHKKGQVAADVNPNEVERMRGDILKNARKITTLETQGVERARERDEDRAEWFATRKDIFERLNDLDRKVTEILTILNERKNL